MNNRPMLNAYPDSIGQNLGDMVEFLSRPALKDVFASFYILPSVSTIISAIRWQSPKI